MSTFQGKLIDDYLSHEVPFTTFLCKNQTKSTWNNKVHSDDTDSTSDYWLGLPNAITTKDDLGSIYDQIAPKDLIRSRRGYANGIENCSLTKVGRPYLFDNNANDFLISRCGFKAPECKTSSLDAYYIDDPRFKLIPIVKADPKHDANGELLPSMDIEYLHPTMMIGEVVNYRVQFSFPDIESINRKISTLANANIQETSEWILIKNKIPSLLNIAYGDKHVFQVSDISEIRGAVKPEDRDAIEQAVKTLRTSASRLKEDPDLQRKLNYYRRALYNDIEIAVKATHAPSCAGKPHHRICDGNVVGYYCECESFAFISGAHVTKGTSMSDFRSDSMIRRYQEFTINPFTMIRMFDNVIHSTNDSPVARNVPHFLTEMRGQVFDLMKTYHYLFLVLCYYLGIDIALSDAASSLTISCMRRRIEDTSISLKSKLKRSTLNGKNQIRTSSSSKKSLAHTTPPLKTDDSSGNSGAVKDKPKTKSSSNTPDTTDTDNTSSDTTQDQCRAILVCADKNTFSDKFDQYPVYFDVAELVSYCKHDLGGKLTGKNITVLIVSSEINTRIHDLTKAISIITEQYGIPQMLSVTTTADALSSLTSFISVRSSGLDHAARRVDATREVFRLYSLPVPRIILLDDYSVMHIGEKIQPLCSALSIEIKPFELSLIPFADIIVLGRSNPRMTADQKKFHDATFSAFKEGVNKKNYVEFINDTSKKFLYSQLPESCDLIVSLLSTFNSKKITEVLSNEFLLPDIPTLEDPKVPLVITNQLWELLIAEGKELLGLLDKDIQWRYNRFRALPVMLRSLLTRYQSWVKGTYVHEVSNPFTVGNEQSALQFEITELIEKTIESRRASGSTTNEFSRNERPQDFSPESILSVMKHVINRSSSDRRHVFFLKHNSITFTREHVLDFRRIFMSTPFLPGSTTSTMGPTGPKGRERIESLLISLMYFHSNVLTANLQYTAARHLFIHGWPSILSLKDLGSGVANCLIAKMPVNLLYDIRSKLDETISTDSNITKTHGWAVGRTDIDQLLLYSGELICTDSCSKDTNVNANYLSAKKSVPETISPHNAQLASYSSVITILDIQKHDIYGQCVTKMLKVFKSIRDAWRGKDTPLDISSSLYGSTNDDVSRFLANTPTYSTQVYVTKQATICISNLPAGSSGFKKFTIIDQQYYQVLKFSHINNASALASLSSVFGITFTEKFSQGMVLLYLDSVDKQVVEAYAFKKTRGVNDAMTKMFSRPTNKVSKFGDEPTPLVLQKMYESLRYVFQDQDYQDPYCPSSNMPHLHSPRLLSASFINQVTVILGYLQRFNLGYSRYSPDTLSANPACFGRLLYKDHVDPCSVELTPRFIRFFSAKFVPDFGYKQYLTMISTNQSAGWDAPVLKVKKDHVSQKDKPKDNQKDVADDENKKEDKSDIYNPTYKANSKAMAIALDNYNLLSLGWFVRSCVDPFKIASRAEPNKVMRAVFIVPMSWLATEAPVYSFFKERMKNDNEFPNSSSESTGKLSQTSKMIDLLLFALTICMDYVGYDRRARINYPTQCLLTFCSRDDISEAKPLTDGALLTTDDFRDDKQESTIARYSSMILKAIARMELSKLSPSTSILDVKASLSHSGMKLFGDILPCNIPVVDVIPNPFMTMFQPPVSLLSGRPQYGAYAQSEDSSLPTTTVDETSIIGPPEYKQANDMIHQRMAFQLMMTSIYLGLPMYVSGDRSKAYGRCPLDRSTSSGSLTTGVGNTLSNSATVEEVNAMGQAYCGLSDTDIHLFNSRALDDPLLQVDFTSSMKRKYGTYINDLRNNAQRPDASQIDKSRYAIAKIFGVNILSSHLAPSLPALPYHFGVSFSLPTNSQREAGDDHVGVLNIISMGTLTKFDHLCGTLCDMLTFITATLGFAMKPKDLRIACSFAVFLNIYMMRASMPPVVSSKRLLNDDACSPSTVKPAARGGIHYRRLLTFGIHENSSIDAPQDFTAGLKVMLCGATVHQVAVNSLICHRMINRSVAGKRAGFQYSKCIDPSNEQCIISLPHMYGSIGPQSIRLYNYGIREVNAVLTKPPHLSTSPADALQYSIERRGAIIGDLTSLVNPKSRDVFSSTSVPVMNKTVPSKEYFDVAIQFGELRGVLNNIPVIMEKSQRDKRNVRSQYVLSNRDKDKGTLDALTSYLSQGSCEWTISLGTSEITFKRNAHAVSRPYQIPMIFGCNLSLLILQMIFGVSVNQRDDPKPKVSLQFSSAVQAAPTRGAIVAFAEATGFSYPDIGTIIGALHPEKLFDQLDAIQVEEKLADEVNYRGNRLTDLSINIVSTSKFLFGYSDIQTHAIVATLVDEVLLALLLRFEKVGNTPELLTRPFNILTRSVLPVSSGNRSQKANV